jgi:HAD superfamily hydrolase (TIGR01509 family)
MLRAALLDIDGTLIDSNNAHAQSWVEALESHGISVPFSTIRPLIGMGGDRLLPAVASIEEDSVHGKAIAKTRERIFRENYLPNLEPFPEVRALLQRLSEEGLRLIVATSSGESLVNDLLERAHVQDLIEAQTTSDDADQSKPSPDIVQAALRRLGLRPEEAIMIGDTPYDVEAARRAGVGAVALECGGWTTQDLGDAKAIYKDAADLLARFDHSIFARAADEKKNLLL